MAESDYYDFIYWNKCITSIAFKGRKWLFWLHLCQMVAIMFVFTVIMWLSWLQLDLQIMMVFNKSKGRKRIAFTVNRKKMCKLYFIRILEVNTEPVSNKISNPELLWHFTLCDIFPLFMNTEVPEYVFIFIFDTKI